MSGLKFDQNLAIREVLDDIIGMIARREKLIASAGKQAKATKDERVAQHVKSLEGLMSDFLTLFQPILEKVRAYGEELKGSISESQAFLKSLAGIIEAGKAIEGSSATVQELEKDAGRVEGDLHTSTETLDKIEALIEATNAYSRVQPKPKQDDTVDRLVQPRTDEVENEPGSFGGLRRSRALRRPRLSSHKFSEGKY